MEKNAVFRRLAHMGSAGFLVYYLLPDELAPNAAPGFHKWHGVLIIMIVVLVFEILRLRYNKVFFGLRPYERHQISAFAWFTIGCGCALLVYERRFVIPAILGMSFIDPMWGECKVRKRSIYPSAPAVVYAVLVFIALYWLTDFSVMVLLGFTIVGTLSAIFSECWNTRIIDDDFLLVMVPLSAMTAFDYILSL